MNKFNTNADLEKEKALDKKYNKDSDDIHHLDNDNDKNWRRCSVSLSDDEGGGLVTGGSPFEREDDDGDAFWSVEAYESSLKLYEEFITGSKDDAYLHPVVQDALEALENAYRLYGPQNVIGSYNGGKDAVVIFHLLRAAHAHYYHTTSTSQKMIRPRVIYFENKDEFPEVEQFLHSTIEKFDCDMLTFPQGTSYATGLKILVQTNHPPNISSTNSNADSIVQPYPMAFALGTRSSDPNAGSQTQYAPSSSYMPPFMRINPIIDFTYGHVWHFLRLFQLPYCSLYDEGYTSLGTVKDTFPCPALKKNNTSTFTEEEKDRLSEEHVASAESSQYWPAYMLRDWDQERAGRPKKKKTTTNITPTISQSSSVISLLAEQKKQMNSDSTANSKQPNGNDTKMKKSGSFSEQNESSQPTTVKQDDKDQESIKSDDDLSFVSSKEQKNVGLIIIGDEILKGLTPDTNTHVAALALRAHNVPLTRVIVVSDDMDEIVDEMQRMQKQVDIIITSGGVGPTHDDVTIKSISNFLGNDMVYNEEMANLLRNKMKTSATEELTTAQTKMATLPTCSKLRYLDKNDKEAWPILQCANIFVLPGVPQFFETKVKTLALYLSTEDIHNSTDTFKVVLSIGEESIVSILNKVVEHHVNVNFGSYPFVGHPECKTVVTLEGRSQRNSGQSTRNDDDNDDNIIFSKDEMNHYVKLALTDLVDQMPEGSVLRVDNNDNLTFD
eukprot:CAMPEP_0197836216 /NCGR_PEP_ID=MMETSP1437-20131217/28273_1 /TAXON_ID=49252 ORGANISM="Eucampia antarctica, Strain CCMP1452" /NCGR_SAMPLE_ID=MMETSP1437 /ASSEMBLY_ACC=CAM_ASM_001096 /LENGTH=723 /DNA_ID=CAMNT_0043442225 /DNA_START=216 /DNA_END=2387 /DNA_ORIENTATION=+